jgi:hypothetical protein
LTASVETLQGSVVVMASLLKPARHRGRYSLAAVAVEIANQIGRQGRGTHKALAAHLGITSQQLSHRLAIDTARLKIEEIGSIADFFNAPPGWPFVAWDVSETAFIRK